MKRERAYCDFLILAPLAIETSAVCLALQAHGWVKSDDTSNSPANDEFRQVREFVREDPNAGRFLRRALIVRLNDQGVLKACSDTARLLEYFEPGYVFSFGIAGSVQHKDAPIGSVVYATELFYYEPSKDRSGNTHSRMTAVPVSKNLRVGFGRLLDCADMPKPLLDGPIASGEKLFADEFSHDLKRIQETNDKILAVEMEAAGVGYAVEQLCDTAEFIAIKGISDLADENKNKIEEPQQVLNRNLAATNAALCLARLITGARLRREFRISPRRSELPAGSKAADEAKVLTRLLSPIGINVDSAPLYQCLYTRPGPIPAYFHWDQTAPDLHWIDFKILAALGSLPKHIVKPCPLVKLLNGQTVASGTWYSSVEKLVGVKPVTDDDIKRQQVELGTYLPINGFSATTEEDVRRELQELAKDGTGILVNAMRFMVGQLCHRRMFIWTWDTHKERWAKMTRVVDISFALFEWSTMSLGGNPGKTDLPGRDLFIGPSCDSIRQWLKSRPPSTQADEFLAYFSGFDNWPIDRAGRSSADQIEQLLQHWEAILR